MVAQVVGVSQSRVQSRRGSLAPSRLASMAVSRATSRVGSRVGSRMGSRTNSMNSLHNIDGELPETLGNIKTVTENQEAVMSFFYTDASNQVCPSASDGSYDNMSTGQGDGDLRCDPD